jgi:hypothetical protein
MRIFWFFPVLVLFAGCETAPRPVVAPITATVTGDGLLPVQEPVAEVAIDSTEAALQARDRLLQGGQQHQLLAKSAFRDAPGFTVSNWSGLVLSPTDLRQGIVVGSGYRIDRVETHPLSDGRLRVWVEVVNLTAGIVQPEGACEFRPSESSPMLKFKVLPALAAQGKIIVFFESLEPQMEGYSILVRSKR